MKKIIALILVLVMVLSCAGCSFLEKFADDYNTNSQSEQLDKPENDPNTQGAAGGNTQQVYTGDLDEQLIAYLENTAGYDKQNYVFSPLSFKYAVTLATYGANGATQEELLDAMGYKSMSENLAWAHNFNEFLDKFAKGAEDDLKQEQKWNDEATEVNRKLLIGNSIWHNTNQAGIIKQDYIDYTNEHFGAQAFNIPGKEIKDKVNEWVDKQTNGLIPSLFEQSQEDRNTILINTLYLKAPWMYAFSDHSAKQKTFHGLNGDKQADFMNNQAKYSYYSDKNSEMVTLPLEGGLSCTFVMGDSSNLFDKVEQSKAELLNLSMPKFEIESSFDKKELMNFLKSKGAVTAFNPDAADFSNLIKDAQIYITDIVQKAKFISNEDGIEAASVTALMMDMNTSINPTKPINVIFDKPFKFFVYTDDTQEMLFCGNYCNVG